MIRSVNLGLGIARTEAEVAKKQEALAECFGNRNPVRLTEGMLAGTPQQIIDKIGQFQDAGATWLNAVLRGPIDLDGLQLFIEDVVPAFRS